MSFGVTVFKFCSLEHIFKTSSNSSNSYSFVFITVHLLKTASEKFFVEEVAKNLIKSTVSHINLFFGVVIVLNLSSFNVKVFIPVNNSLNLSNVVVGILSKFLKSNESPLNIAEVNKPGLNSNLILFNILSSSLLLFIMSSNFTKFLFTIFLKTILLPQLELVKEKKFFISFFSFAISNFPFFNSCKRVNLLFLAQISQIKDK